MSLTESFFNKNLMNTGQCTMYVLDLLRFELNFIKFNDIPQSKPQICMDLENFFKGVSEEKLYLLEGGLKFSIILLRVCEFNKSLFFRWDRTPQPPLDLHMTDIQRFLSVGS